MFASVPFILNQKGRFLVSQLKLCPLRSSSKGNATIVFTKNTKILVDCGISAKALEECLSYSNTPAKSLDGIVVTHEHTDHIKGVGVVSRRFDIPIFANKETWEGMEKQIGKISPRNRRVFEVGNDFLINDITICSFSIPHDAANPVGYTFFAYGEKVAVATDMGIITKEISHALFGSHTALIEANYDTNMLEVGPYPYELKRRIKGDWGHLCNEDCGCLAQFLAENGTSKIFLGHLSEENNFPLLALKTVETSLESCCKEAEDFTLSVITGEGRIICSN